MKINKNLLLLLLVAGGAQAGVIDYQIDVNTTSLEGTMGYLDFQFNPGDNTSDPASATLEDFMTDGTLDTAAMPMGDVSGEFPGTVTIDNTDADNEYTPGITFNSFFDIFVELDIPTISGNAQTGSSLAISLYDSNFNSLLTDPADDPTVQVNLDINGDPTVINNSPNGEASITAVVPTPEPSALALSAAGVFALGLLRRRKQ